MKMILLAAALVALNAHAQTPQVTIAQEVERLAPQLVAFAGSRGNFESLVTGLALGVPVTLTTVSPGNLVQTTTFALPGGAQTDAVQIARTLETARQQLIAQGVATPTAQQLGELVSGTAVPVTVTALPPAATPTTPVQPPAVPGTGATGATGASVPSPAEQVQQRNSADMPRINTSDSRNLGNTSATPAPPTAPTVARQPPPPPVTRSPILAPSR